MFQRQLIDPLFEDIFDACIFNVVEMQCAKTGAFQTDDTIFFSKPDNALGAPEMIQNLIAKEFPDDLMAGRSDGFRLLQAPLGVLQLPGNSPGRHVLIDGGISSGLVKPGMSGHKMKVIIKFDNIICGLQPEFFVCQRIRG